MTCRGIWQRALPSCHTVASWKHSSLWAPAEQMAHLVTFTHTVSAEVWTFKINCVFCDDCVECEAGAPSLRWCVRNRASRVKSRLFMKHRPCLLRTDHPGSLTVGPLQALLIFLTNHFRKCHIQMWLVVMDTVSCTVGCNALKWI